MVRAWFTVLLGGVQPQSETVWRQVNKYKVPSFSIREQDGPYWCKLLPCC